MPEVKNIEVFGWFYMVKCAIIIHIISDVVVKTMERVWNALRYGDSETRKCIGSVILFIVIGIVLIVVSGLTGKIGIFIVGMLCGVIALVISQTFTLVDDDFVAEVGKEGEKDSIKSVSVKKIGGSSSSAKKDEAANDKKSKESEQDNDEEKSLDKAKEEYMDADRYSQYNEQVLKKIKKKYRVKKDHRPIIIDHSKSYGIRECPAFIWRAHNKVYLLLLEKEPRKICISRDMIHNVGYRPGMKADRTKEYVAFHKENLVTSVFSSYLPDYYSSKVKNDPLKIKNLYTIYPDICISNRSIAQVMDLLYLNFMPEDKITTSDKLNGYFKRIYAANILYKDKAYSITEYKDAVESTLGEMAYAEMSEKEYSLTLSNLVKGRLISQEYADYYLQHRK